MAVVMSMHWPEASLEVYEAARRNVGWETEVPAGAQFHVAWMADDGLRVLDLWDSPEDFQRFAQERLLPVVQQLGVTTEPRVTIDQIHALFVPGEPSEAAPRPRARRQKARKAATRRSAARPKKSAKAPAKKSSKKAKTKRATLPARGAKSARRSRR